MIGTYPFKDYEGFKELFVREDGRRKNAVLLNCLKNREFRNWCIATNNSGALAIRDMSTLKTWILDRMARTRKNRYDDVRLMDHWFCSPLYYLDGREGLCEDRDYKAIRYCRRDTGRVYKMKAGRFFRHLIGETHIGDVLPESAILWMCEEFQRDWETYTRAKLPPVESLELHVDDNFDKIYDGRHLLGNFGSCMVDEDRHEFYENSVDAKAAYLTNENNKIVVSDVKMIVPAVGTVDLTVSPYSWVVEGQTVALDFGKAIDKTDATNDKLAVTGKGEVEYERLTIPIATTSSIISSYEVSFNVTIYNGDQVGQTIPMTSTINGTSFLPGKCYNLTATLTAENLGLQVIEFTATVEDWVDAGELGFLN
jgi:hypothetical protein